MPSITPQTITKAVIKELSATPSLKTKEEKIAFAHSKMVELWADAFPLVTYVDDAKRISEIEKKKHKARPKPTEQLANDISFDDAWGEEINDTMSYAGTAIGKAEDDKELPACTLNAHISTGLTRAMLSRVGFSKHGGIVITLLNPMLSELGATINKGSHIEYGAQRYRIEEIGNVVKWDMSGQYLYTAVNCIA